MFHCRQCGADRFPVCIQDSYFINPETILSDEMERLDDALMHQAECPLCGEPGKQMLIEINLSKNRLEIHRSNPVLATRA